MAGVMFSFYNFAALVDLNIGIANRLDENRSESFSIMFCDFSGLSSDLVEANLSALFRTSDAIVHYDRYYFFVMPYTDRYGTGMVKRMIDELFNAPIPSSAVCYPADGENPAELFEALHAEVKKTHRIDLECLDEAATREF
ncbi:MAG: hypothetical protein JXK04_06515 [Campylobacterales bacterium]|nr:hypothetical protein [Campylobacterales bacterium]